jgi:hypothetical protein
MSTTAPLVFYYYSPKSTFNKDMTQPIYEVYSNIYLSLDEEGNLSNIIGNVIADKSSFNLGNNKYFCTLNATFHIYNETKDYGIINFTTTNDMIFDENGNRQDSNTSCLVLWASIDYKYLNPSNEKKYYIENEIKDGLRKITIPDYFPVIIPTYNYIPAFYFRNLFSNFNNLVKQQTYGIWGPIYKSINEFQKEYARSGYLLSVMTCKQNAYIPDTFDFKDIVFYSYIDEEGKSGNIVGIINTSGIKYNNNGIVSYFKPKVDNINSVIFAYILYADGIYNNLNPYYSANYPYQVRINYDSSLRTFAIPDIINNKKILPDDVIYDAVYANFLFNNIDNIIIYITKKYKDATKEILELALIYAVKLYDRLINYEQNDVTKMDDYYPCLFWDSVNTNNIDYRYNNNGNYQTYTLTFDYKGILENNIPTGDTLGLGIGTFYVVDDKSKLIIGNTVSIRKNNSNFINCVNCNSGNTSYEGAYLDGVYQFTVIDSKGYNDVKYIFLRKLNGLRTMIYPNMDSYNYKKLLVACNI